MLNGGNVVLNNGWKLKCGKYVDSYVSETQVWDLFVLTYLEGLISGR